VGNNKIPTNWKGFLRDEKNKEELFSFLSVKIMQFKFPDGKKVFVTDGPFVLTNDTTQSMPQCDHEEADTRVVIHLIDALEKGLSTCLVRTVDTDIIVILLGKLSYFITVNSDANVWVAFGTGKNFAYWHINTIYFNLGQDKCIGLPLFHSFTGCDTTSSFFRKGKKMALEVWNSFPEITSVFSKVTLQPFEDFNADSLNFRMLERYTILLYNKSSTLESVDEARMELFCRENRLMENIPPTSDALLQHARRATYQASVWASSHNVQQNRPTPESWGWKWDEHSKEWTPVWTTLPMASSACMDLVKCSCKSEKGCGTRCGCRKANLSCTDLCKCNCLLTNSDSS